MSKGVDFSYDKPDGKALKADGFDFVVGYVSGNAGKDISATQAATYRKDGLDVHFVYEGTGREALSESSLKAHIIAADKLMKARGASDDEPLFVAVDFQPSSSQIVTLNNNLATAKKAVKRKVGYYGDYSLIKYCMDHGMEVGWQTYAWSGGQLDKRVQFYQYSNNHHVAGGTVDYNIQEHDLPGATPAPKPKPPSAPKYSHELINVAHPKFDQEAKDWQAQMKKLGYTIGVDGLYGTQSKNVAKAFQKAKKLHVDGVVGPNTWKASFA